MSYWKQVIYLELRENGQRTKNVGYAKLECLEKEDILTVRITGLPVMDSRKVPLYLQRETAEELLCELVTERGRTSCEITIRKGDEKEQIRGIRILLEQDTEVKGSFVKAVKETRVQEKQVPSGETSEKGNPPVENKEPKDREKSKDRKQDRPLHMMDTKWEQLSSIYPHIHPFRDAREFLSVGPEDFVVLRERCYQITHNSFLLHGYYNYRHLLLMRRKISEQMKYYIGVPGNFYEREKQVAGMFGFECFEGVREPAREGDFGYYMIPVEL